MDEAEGFFPERRLLAYRRSLLPAEPVPAAAAPQSTSAWWLLPVCLGPSYLSIGVSLYQRHSTGALPPPIILKLILASCLLAASALIAVAVVHWTRRALRSS
jgi:hypothetical protein